MAWEKSRVLIFPTKTLRKRWKRQDLKGYFVFFFYSPAFHGGFPVGCLAASLADTANFLHVFYSDYHAPMTQQVDIPRME